MKYNNIAHINENGQIQTIEEHNRQVSYLAQKFCDSFHFGVDTSHYGQIVGLYHDVGKSSEDFGRHICENNKELVDHKTAGARYLFQNKLLAGALSIEGHHVGIPNLLDTTDSCFARRMDDSYKIPDFDKSLFNKIPSNNIDDFTKEDAFRYMFFTRMLFSALTDADALDTEQFMKSNVERVHYESIAVLRERFNQYVTNNFLCRNPINELHAKRNEVLVSCMDKGKEAKNGFYNLTAPCGVGKTYATMGFALNHSGIKRIIYVLPFTTIITQNAKAFAKILGSENIIEHHEMANLEDTEESRNHRLAAENWDAPIIVTTEVQFFESLFSNKPSKCRKLHNIADSVIIFDEAQKIPETYLEPCILILSNLVKYANVTVLFSTATQPGLRSYIQKYSKTQIMELYDDYPYLYKIVRRNKIVNVGRYALTDLAVELGQKHNVLCIVNRKKTAQELYNCIKEIAIDTNCFCLTRYLTQYDINRQVEDIRKQIASKQRCIVIATSLIEAGVDLDFDEVYRENAALDSILQAAGRCNREAKRAVDDSVVSVFSFLDGESHALQMYQTSTNEVYELYGCYDTLECIEEYFNRLHVLLGKNLDRKQIIQGSRDGIPEKNGSGLCVLPFKRIAEIFKLIESETTDIVVPIESEARQLIDEIERLTKQGISTRILHRKLRRFIVSVYDRDLKELYQNGVINKNDAGDYILLDSKYYNSETGLVLTNPNTEELAWII